MAWIDSMKSVYHAPKIAQTAGVMLPRIRRMNP
jgi:hypothetical protein